MMRGRIPKGREPKRYRLARKWNPFSLSHPQLGHPRKWRALTPSEQTIIRKKFGSNLRCSFIHVDGKLGRRGKKRRFKGFFCYTHRARCKVYPTPDGITMKEYKFISSTG